MKDERKIKIQRYDPQNDWLKGDFYKTTFPILSQPAKNKNDICGTGFLLDKDGTPYIITAKHIATIDNPTFLFTRKGRKNIFMDTNYFIQEGQSWNLHPKMDLAALKFASYDKIKDKLDNYAIQNWGNPVQLRPGAVIRHLGYPEKKTGTYLLDNSPANIPMGMVGTIISANSKQIILDSPAQFGASGGPAFVKTTGGPYLIGVVTQTTIKIDRKNVSNSIYTGKTTALPISYLKEIMR